jgi:hypothetical protein
MRVFPRVALVVIVLLTAPILLANHLQADCPLSLVATDPPASDFNLSPHGTFRSGQQVFALRGQTLTTYSTNAVGDLQVARQDFIGSLGARETNGGVAFRAESAGGGYLFLSSEAGLEIYDLRGVRAGGTAPLLVGSPISGLHYRRLAVSGNVLAGLYPATDLPCSANGTSLCSNSIDLFDISNLSAPAYKATISTKYPSANSYLWGFNDIAFNYGFLIATAIKGTAAYNVSNPAVPYTVSSIGYAGTFLVSNGSYLLGVGNDRSVLTYSFSSTGGFTPLLMHNISPSLQIDRSNAVVFHPEATYDDAGNRLITMADERDPLTGKPARTIAFDVFDLDVPQYEGSDPRIYETITATTPDEVKGDPFAVGPYIYTIGEMSGLQTWGACGQMAGKIELDAVSQLSCNGAEIHGWVTGAQKIANVEIFLDAGSLGSAIVSGLPRNDVPANTPVLTWRLIVNLDSIANGDHVMRAVGTDSLGNRRQFASQRIYFPGPGANCTTRRRLVAIHF